MSDCVVSHGFTKDGDQRTVRATEGLLCSSHARRLAEWLRDIAVDYALLETRVAPSLIQLSGERHASGADPAAPLNLAVVALRDAERAGAPRAKGDELWYELPDIPSVLPTVHAIAEDIRCLLDPTREPDPSVKDRHVVTEVTYLLDTLPTLCAADIADQAFAEIKGVWIALQRAHDRPKPSPVGPCLSECDGTVWPRQNAAPWCSTCRRVYDTDAELIKVRIQGEKRRKRATA